MPDRPNILLIMADQMIPHLTGAYGHPVVQTPHLNRLVEEGVRFDAAYSSCPLCAPARASLYTGRFVSRIGAYDNATPFSSEQPTLCHYLTNAGYETVSSGKLHYVGPDQLHGFRHRLNADIYPASLEWTPTSARDGDDATIDRRSHARGYALPNVGVRTWSKFLAYDAETQYRAIEYLHNRTLTPSGPDTEPFFLSVSFHCPHDPFHVTQDLWDLYEGQEIEIPTYPDNMEETYSAMDRWLNAYHGTDRIDIRRPESLTALRRSYYGLVTWIDRKVGELMAALEHTGVLDNTLVIFASDHGDMLAEKNMVQKRSFYEYSCRVPLIMRFPDGYGSGAACGQPASLMDITPTLLDIAGVRERMPMEGRSLLPCIEGDEADRVVFAESHTNGVYAPCFMARQADFKYVYIHSKAPQLFDVRRDPGEWHNLAGAPEHAGVEADLRGRILATFDPDAIERDLVESLRNRAIVQEALVRNKTQWEYEPRFDVTYPYTPGRPKA